MPINFQVEIPNETIIDNIIILIDNFRFDHFVAILYMIGKIKWGNFFYFDRIYTFLFLKYIHKNIIPLFNNQNMGENYYSITILARKKMLAIDITKKNKLN